MAIRPAYVPGLPENVEVRRSNRRKRSVAAFRDGGRTIIVVPDRMPAAEAVKHALTLNERLQRKKRQPMLSEEQLMQRARELSQRYLPGTPLPSSIRWSNQQNRLWASCTSVDGSIRLSDRIMRMPEYVVDCVIVHELAHLLVAHHGPQFDLLLSRYPDRERATSFLDGVEFAKANMSDR